MSGVKTVDRGTYFYIEMSANDAQHLQSILFTVRQISSWHYVDWTKNKVVWHLQKLTPQLPLLERVKQ